MGAYLACQEGQQLANQRTDCETLAFRAATKRLSEAEEERPNHGIDKEVCHGIPDRGAASGRKTHSFDPTSYADNAARPTRSCIAVGTTRMFGMLVTTWVATFFLTHRSLSHSHTESRGWELERFIIQGVEICAVSTMNVSIRREWTEKHGIATAARSPRALSKNHACHLAFQGWTSSVAVVDDSAAMCNSGPDLSLNCFVEFTAFFSNCPAGAPTPGPPGASRKGTCKALQTFANHRRC